MAKSKTRPYDAAEYLESEEDMAAYLQAALEEGDPARSSTRWAISPVPAACRRLPGRRALAARAFTRRFLPRGIRSSPRSSRWSSAIGIRLNAEPTHAR